MAIGVQQQAARRKGTEIGRREWLFVSKRACDTHVEEVGKHSIMHRAGLPGRDLRVLDPMLSYPSTILGRERAIVVNLEHIKAIITANEVLMLNSTNPLVVQFVQDLQKRVSSTTDSNPFELRAVEACLESACRCLESETETLVQDLDELTSKISTLNLERVRQIKSRLVTISGSVQKVKDALEHLLDDDIDMAEMYLTRKVQDSENRSKPNIEGLEKLLEAYFAQIDGILQKLSDMSEYVDNAEDCINIILDAKQNQLLEMGVMMNTANMVLNAGIVVVGIFGMNITIALFDGKPVQVLEATFGTIGGVVALYIIAVWWGKKKNFLAL